MEIRKDTVGPSSKFGSSECLDGWSSTLTLPLCDSSTGIRLQHWNKDCD